MYRHSQTLSIEVDDAKLRKIGMAMIGGVLFLGLGVFIPSIWDYADL